MVDARASMRIAGSSVVQVAGERLPVELDPGQGIGVDQSHVLGGLAALSQGVPARAHELRRRAIRHGPGRAGRGRA